MQPFDLMIIVVLILFLLLIPLILVRCVKDLYDDKGSTGAVSGGIVGMMVEMDRIVNPSSEHVTEAKEVERQEEEIGGDQLSWKAMFYSEMFLQSQIPMSSVKNSMSGGVRLSEPVYCPYCADPVSGEAVTLWDDRVYCRKCVEDVSSELFEFVTNGGRLEETVEKSDVSLKKYFKGAGQKTVVVAFIIFMLPFVLLAVLDQVNAKVDLLIGFLIFCGGFVIGYLLLKMKLELIRRSLPRTVAIESGELLVIRPQDEIRFPLTECKWKFGGVDRDGITYFTGLQKGITINSAADFISCGHSPEMLKYWGAFLILAGVRRKSYWDALRIFLISVTGTLVGFLFGWSVGHLVALLTNNQSWIFSLGFLGAFDGLGTGFNYAYYTSYGAKAAHKRMNPGFLGGAFFLIGIKVGMIAGAPIALLCGGINGVLGVIVAWCCRLWIENRGIQDNTEVTGLVQRKLIELSQNEC